jgi:hypothetical protein
LTGGTTIKVAVLAVLGKVWASDTSTTFELYSRLTCSAFVLVASLTEREKRLTGDTRPIFNCKSSFTGCTSGDVTVSALIGDVWASVASTLIELYPWLTRKTIVLVAGLTVWELRLASDTTLVFNCKSSLTGGTTFGGAVLTLFGEVQASDATATRELNSRLTGKTTVFVAGHTVWESRLTRYTFTIFNRKSRWTGVTAITVAVNAVRGVTRAFIA